MALQQKRDTRKTVLYAIAFGVVVVGGIIALIVLNPKSTTTDETTGSIRTGNDLPIYSSFGEEFYQSEQYKELRDYLEDTPTIPATNTNTNARNPEPFRLQ